MTSAVMETEDGDVPLDTFAVRLAVVRAVQGWNYDQAEAATGVNSESWRTWEKGTRRCSDVVGIARRISTATGLSWRWIATGGPLLQEVKPTGDIRRYRRRTLRELVSGRRGRLIQLVPALPETA